MTGSMSFYVRKTVSCIGLWSGCLSMKAFMFDFAKHVSSSMWA